MFRMPVNLFDAGTEVGGNDGIENMLMIVYGINGSVNDSLLIPSSCHEVSWLSRNGVQRCFCLV